MMLNRAFKFRDSILSPISYKVLWKRNASYNIVTGKLRVSLAFVAATVQQHPARSS